MHISGQVLFSSVWGIFPSSVLVLSGFPVLLGVVAVLLPVLLGTISVPGFVFLLSQTWVVMGSLSGFGSFSFPAAMPVIFAPLSVIFIIRQRSSSLCFFWFWITVFIFYILISFMGSILSTMVTISAIGLISLILWYIFSPVWFFQFSVISFWFALSVTSFLLLPPSCFLFRGLPFPFLFFPGNFIGFSIFLLKSLSFGFRNIWNDKKIGIRFNANLLHLLTYTDLFFC